MTSARYHFTLLSIEVCFADSYFRIISNVDYSHLLHCANEFITFVCLKVLHVILNGTLHLLKLYLFLHNGDGRFLCYDRWIVCSCIVMK